MSLKCRSTYRCKRLQVEKVLVRNAGEEKKKKKHKQESLVILKEYMERNLNCGGFPALTHASGFLANLHYMSITDLQHNFFLEYCMSNICILMNESKGYFYNFFMLFKM